ncbi:hypothetical protein PspLS_11756 [Pyricularia sp. CBS 133598]|nr:hypothetical protein PspLS_11756 [Pyricularia sp. CBS 133598]
MTKTVECFAKLVSDNAMENCPRDAFRDFEPKKRQPDKEKDLLRPPLTEVAELEARLGIDLPQDHNMEPIWDGGPLLDILARPEYVDWKDLGNMSCMEACLIREEDPSQRSGNGPVDMFLLDKETTAACKQPFVEQFEQRTVEQKEQL